VTMSDTGREGRAGMKNGIRAVSVVLIVGAMYCPSALADEYTDNRITESALRETRDILSCELLGHYDITDLSVKRIEDLRGLGSLRHDYGLVKATLTFSTKRNTTKHPNLNRDMFEPGSGMCQGSLYLHRGVRLDMCSREGSRYCWQLTETAHGERCRHTLAIEKGISTPGLSAPGGAGSGRVCAVPQAAVALMPSRLPDASPTPHRGKRRRGEQPLVPAAGAWQ
jgi:hypothetical protein